MRLRLRGNRLRLRKGIIEEHFLQSRFGNGRKRFDRILRSAQVLLLQAIQQTHLVGDEYGERREYHDAKHGPAVAATRLAGFRKPCRRRDIDRNGLRRLDIQPLGRGRSRTSLGVEFLVRGPADRQSTQVVRQYVMAQQRRLLSSRSADAQPV